MLIESPEFATQEIRGYSLYIKGVSELIKKIQTSYVTNITKLIFIVGCLFLVTGLFAFTYVRNFDIGTRVGLLLKNEKKLYFTLDRKVYSGRDVIQYKIQNGFSIPIYYFPATCAGSNIKLVEIVNGEEISLKAKYPYVCALAPAVATLNPSQIFTGKASIKESDIDGKPGTYIIKFYYSDSMENRFRLGKTNELSSASFVVE